MYCNADIFFSVLILHWATSKDSSSTSSSNLSLSFHHISASGHDQSRPMSPNSIIDKLEAFGIYGTGKEMDSTVTTHISAQEMQSNLGREFCEGDSGGKLKKGGKGEVYHLERIHVNVAKVVEIKGGPRRNDGRILRMW